MMRGWVGDEGLGGFVVLKANIKLHVCCVFIFVLLRVSVFVNYIVFS